MAAFVRHNPCNDLEIKSKIAVMTNRGYAEYVVLGTDMLLL